MNRRGDIKYEAGLFLKELSGLLVPSTCCVCGRRTSAQEAHICLHCLLEMPRTNLHYANPSITAANEIQERLSWMPPLRYAAAWFYYSSYSPYAEVVRHAKYFDRPGIAVQAGELYGAELVADTPSLTEDIDVLLPVPMHWSKHIRRGYNQSRLICRGLSRATGIPVGDNLAALRGHRTQTRKSVFERREALSDIFAVEEPRELEGLNAAIVDDVITTGATIGRCATVLLEQAAVNSVSVLALGLTR